MRRSLRLLFASLALLIAAPAAATHLAEPAPIEQVERVRPARSVIRPSVDPPLAIVAEIPLPPRAIRRVERVYLKHRALLR